MLNVNYPSGINPLQGDFLYNFSLQRVILDGYLTSNMPPTIVVACAWFRCVAGRGYLAPH